MLRWLEVEWRERNAGRVQMETDTERPEVSAGDNAFRVDSAVIKYVESQKSYTIPTSSTQVKSVKEAGAVKPASQPLESQSLESLPISTLRRLCLEK